MSTTERTPASVVVVAPTAHVVQAPHLASTVGAVAFVALMSLAGGVALQRREVTVPVLPLPFRRRGPPPPTRD